MPKKAILALATLIVFGSASAALAESNNGTNHRGAVVRAGHHRLCSNSATLLPVMP